MRRIHIVETNRLIFSSFLWYVYEKCQNYNNILQELDGYIMIRIEFIFIDSSLGSFSPTISSREDYVIESLPLRGPAHVFFSVKERRIRTAKKM